MYIRRSLTHLNALLLSATISLVEARTPSEETIRQTYYPEDFSQFVPDLRSILSQVQGSVLTRAVTIGVSVRLTPMCLLMDVEYPKVKRPYEALNDSVESIIRLEVVDGASLDGGISGQVINVITAAEKEVTGFSVLGTRPTGSIRRSVSEIHRCSDRWQYDLRDREWRMSSAVLVRLDMKSFEIR